MHYNTSITGVNIYRNLELIFNNLYVASNYINLTATDFNTFDTVQYIRIKFANNDSLKGKFTLLMHIIVILVVGMIITFFLYKCLSRQTEEEFEEFASFDEEMELYEKRVEEKPAPVSLVKVSSTIVDGGIGERMVAVMKGELPVSSKTSVDSPLKPDEVRRDVLESPGLSKPVFEEDTQPLTTPTENQP